MESKWKKFLTQHYQLSKMNSTGSDRKAPDGDSGFMQPHGKANE